MLYLDWKKMGFLKRTLHYMKMNVESGKSFILNKHVRVRLENWSRFR